MEQVFGSGAIGLRAFSGIGAKDRMRARCRLRGLQPWYLGLSRGENPAVCEGAPDSRPGGVDFTKSGQACEEHDKAVVARKEDATGLRGFPHGKRNLQNPCIRSSCFVERFLLRVIDSCQKRIGARDR